MTAPTATLGVDSTFLASLVDSGRWAERGVTHWHCHAEEQPITVGGRPNEARFNTDRIRELVDRQPTEIAKSPLDALGWLVDQWTRAVNDPYRCSDRSAVLAQRLWHTEDLWHQQLAHTWDTLTTSAATPAGCGLQVKPGWSLDAFCYPMTIARCRRHS